MRNQEYKRELAKKNFTTHGKRNTRLYNIWCCMKKRCYNPNYTYYENYGGRGIKVYSKWRNDFESFYKWSMSHGYSDDLTLDRKNNDKGYYPFNCRWVNRRVQNSNSRNCHYLEYKGETHTISEWSNIVDIPMKTIHLRITRLNWSVERALTTPVQKHRK